VKTFTVPFPTEGVHAAIIKHVLLPKFPNLTTLNLLSSQGRLNSGVFVEGMKFISVSSGGEAVSDVFKRRREVADAW